MQPPFEILEHPADIGFRAYGNTREELYQNAALALFSLACDLATVEELESREIETAGSDEEALLYAWLAELLAVSEADRLVFRRAEIRSLDTERIRGVAYGELYNRARHQRGTHIKAVTFHQLRVDQTPAGWSAQVYLDL